MNWRIVAGKVDFFFYGIVLQLDLKECEKPHKKSPASWRIKYLITNQHIDWTKHLYHTT